MAPRERTEVREDGKQYKVVTLPSDPRLAPAASRKRALFASLSSVEKRRLIEERIRASKKKRKRRRRKKR